MARSIRVSEAEADLIDRFSDLDVDVSAFVDALDRAVQQGSNHPITFAAATIEAATFATPVERGDAPVPEATF
jgi:hypothetical protein